MTKINPHLILNPANVESVRVLGEFDSPGGKNEGRVEIGLVSGEAVTFDPELLPNAEAHAAQIANQLGL